MSSSVSHNLTVFIRVEIAKAHARSVAFELWSKKVSDAETSHLVFSLSNRKFS